MGRRQGELLFVLGLHGQGPSTLWKGGGGRRRRTGEAGTCQAAQGLALSVGEEGRRKGSSGFGPKQSRGLRVFLPSQRLSHESHFSRETAWVCRKPVSATHLP